MGSLPCTEQAEQAAVVQSRTHAPLTMNPPAPTARKYKLATDSGHVLYTAPAYMPNVWCIVRWGRCCDQSPYPRSCAWQASSAWVVPLNPTPSNLQLGARSESAGVNEAQHHANGRHEALN